VLLNVQVNITQLNSIFRQISDKYKAFYALHLQIVEARYHEALVAKCDAMRDTSEYPQLQTQIEVCKSHTYCSNELMRQLQEEMSEFRMRVQACILSIKTSTKTLTNSTDIQDTYALISSLISNVLENICLCIDSEFLNTATPAEFRAFCQEMSASLDTECTILCTFAENSQIAFNCIKVNVECSIARHEKALSEPKSTRDHERHIITQTVISIAERIKQIDVLTKFHASMTPDNMFLNTFGYGM
jgi:hypothetical protein